jgi:hypothetical protein
MLQPMKILFLDSSAVLAARFHSDAMVKAMLPKAFELLCITHHNNPNLENYHIVQHLIKLPVTYDHNVFTLWTQEFVDNYIWVAQLADELCFEYKERFNVAHKLEPAIHSLVRYLPNLDCSVTIDIGFIPTDFVLSSNIPENCIVRYKTSMAVSAHGKLITNNAKNRNRYFVNVVESYRNFLFFKNRQNLSWYSGAWQPDWFIERTNIAE